MNVEWAELLEQRALQGGGWVVPRIRALSSWAGRFLNVKCPNPLPEFWHLPEDGDQGSP